MGKYQELAADIVRNVGAEKMWQGLSTASQDFALR